MGFIGEADEAIPEVAFEDVLSPTPEATQTSATHIVQVEVCAPASRGNGSGTGIPRRPQTRELCSEHGSPCRGIPTNVDLRSIGIDLPSRVVWQRSRWVAITTGDVLTCVRSKPLIHEGEKRPDGRNNGFYRRSR